MRLRLFFALTLAFAVLVPPAKAQVSTFQLSQEHLDFIAAAPAADDLAVGEGKFAPTEKGESMQFTVSAHGPSGPPPLFLAPAHGNVRIKINGVEERGTVECLAVIGNVALAVEGTLEEQVTVPALGGTFPDFFIQLTDNGEPNAQDGAPDEAIVGLDFNPAPCLVAYRPLQQGPIVQGNIVVMDRP